MFFIVISNELSYYTYHGYRNFVIHVTLSLRGYISYLSPNINYIINKTARVNYFSDGRFHKIRTFRSICQKVCLAFLGRFLKRLRFFLATIRF